MENGVRLLYLRLFKYLYGCMESTLLWYDLYTNTLNPMGSLTKPDIVTSTLSVKGNTTNRDGRIDTSLPDFRGK